MIPGILRFAAAALLAVSPAAAEPPSRVAIAGGVSTEIAFLLGADAQIVGVDNTSRHPPAALQKPQLGYFRRLSAEGVLSLAPDLLIASPDAGPPAALEQIRSAGADVAVPPEVLRLDQLPAKVRFIGQALGRHAEAAKLADALQAEIAALIAGGAPTADAPRVLFLLTIRDGAPLVVGGATPADDVIRVAGGVNAAGFEGYKPMSQEAVVAAAPDVLLMTEEHAGQLGGPAGVMGAPLFDLTPAGRNKRGIALPALTLLSLGPRTPESVRRLRAVFPPASAD